MYKSVYVIIMDQYLCEYKMISIVALASTGVIKYVHMYEFSFPKKKTMYKQ